MITNMRLLALSTAFIAACFALVHAASAQAPGMSAPAFLPGQGVLGAAPGTQRAAAACLGTGSTLVVFEDNRGGNYDIYGLRLDAAGNAIDSLPFPICKFAGDQTAPRLAFNGQNWLVICDSNAPVGGYFTHQTVGVRVAPNGSVLDAAPIQLGSDSTGGYYSVASDGNNWVVVNTGFSAGNAGITARRVSPAGVVLDPAGVVVMPSGGSINFGLDIAYNQGSYLVAWQGSSGMVGKRINSSLVVLDPAPKTLTTAGPARLVSNNNHYLLIGTRPGWFVFTDVVATRLDKNANVLDATPIDVALNQVYQPEPRATWDGTNWAISWFAASGGVSATRMSSAGAILDGAGVPLATVTGGLYTPAMGALPGGGSMVVWEDIRNSSTTISDVFGNTFNAAGAAGMERLVVPGNENYVNPRVTAGPDEYLVTWRAEGAGLTRILANRVDRNGNILNAQPIEIKNAAHYGLFPGGAAWNGFYYLVVWSDSQLGRVYARRMLSDGTLFDAIPIDIMPGIGADVAANGTDFLVSALRSPGNPQIIFAYGARVRGVDGVVLDSPAKYLAGNYATRTRLVSMGGRWLAVTESHFSHNDTQSGILGTFVEADGTVNTATVISTAIIGAPWGIVDVASSGTDALVVYQSGSNWVNTDTYAQRVQANGNLVGSPMNLSLAMYSGQSRPTVAWNGNEYVVAFESLQNNPENYDREPDVQGVVVPATGAPAAGQGFPIWNSNENEYNPHSRGLGNGRALIAAAVFDSSVAAFGISIRSERPAGMKNYGVGTPGCNGAEVMDSGNAAFIGNPNFRLLTYFAPVNSLGLVIVTDSQDFAGSDPFGINLLMHVDFALATEVLSYDMNSGAPGIGELNVAIANDNSLVGKKYYAQSIWYWPGACVPSPLELSSSDGLEVEIQNP